MRDYLESLEKFGINLGLERITRLLEKLGNPHLKFKSIHAAGTNGKGSTCAIIASILKEAGYKVGLYTSPHLLDYTERIKINGIDISRREFADGIRRIKKAAEEIRGQRRRIGQPTVFEVLTALAFWYFAKKEVDYAVVEVGLGGRLDATNVITPLVSVITNIDYEHRAILGNTLARIAFEKGGIIKPKVPVVTAERKREPLLTLKKICEERGSLLAQVDRAPGTGALVGEHQQTNAACAIAAIRLAGIKVVRKDIAGGLKGVNWPGRFQVISRKPLTIVDGAHNPAGMFALIKTLRGEYPGRKFTFIFGAQKDKNYAAMLRLIKPLAKEIIYTYSSNHQAARGFRGRPAVKLPTALEQTKGDDRVITGSLYLAGEVLQLQPSPGLL